MATPFISMLGASFRLGDSTVFRNTNWQFLKQQHWAVLGPNGSGKSLFADALCGSLPLIAGELNYHFRPPAGYSHEEAIAKVTFDDRKAQNHDTVVQSRWTSFEQESSSIVREFLSYDRVMEINPFEVTTRHESLRRSFGRRQQRVSRLLELASLMHKTLLALSNGERQRVELARALCRPLRLLILDDPMTGLDAANRVAFARVLNWIMRGSTRVLYITHRAEDLPAAITHELWIGDCQVKEAGSRRTTPGNLRKRTRAPGLKPKLIASTARASNSEPALLKFKSVTVRYGAATLLDGLNWTVQQGESWALLGANGSGKSTLLSLALGDNPQVYNNDVTVFGILRGTGESLFDLKQRIGWVSPELQVHYDPSTTCSDAVASGFEDTIGLFGPLSRTKRARARDVLDQFGLTAVAGIPLSGVSAGFQRMVMLARAFVKQPELLILDEPCQGLDAAHRGWFIDQVDQLIRSGNVTVIYVTHRLDEIPRSIARALRLTSGKGAVFRIQHPSASGSRTLSVSSDRR